MSKNVWGIVVIFLGASLAWIILGGTLLARTSESNVQQSRMMTQQWGSPQVQVAPQVSARVGKADVGIPILGSRVDVNFDLQQRRKGLLWYDVYAVHFASYYRIRNSTSNPNLDVKFTFPDPNGSYTNFSCVVAGRPVDVATAIARGTIPVVVEPGQEATIDISYDSRGMDSWIYSFGDGVQAVGDFTLTMTTNFGAIDFPAQTLLPTSEQTVGAGRRLQWTYSTLLTGDGVGMQFPYPMQPGPLAQRLTFWAPVALAFYFFAMVTLTTLRKVELHPANYFFLAAAFFAFHLLFAYLVDRIAVEAAFAICSVVSIFLTVSYLRLVAGWRFAAVESGLAQFLYLVLFSLALFNEGWSGLTITIGAIVTLFVAMQLTGRIRWGERLAAGSVAGTG